MICSVWLTSVALLEAQLLLLLPASFYALELPLLLTAAYVFVTLLVLFRVGVSDNRVQLMSAVRKVAVTLLSGAVLALIAILFDWVTPSLLIAAYVLLTVLFLVKIGVGDNKVQLVRAVRVVVTALLLGTALAFLAAILDWGTGLVRAQISGYSVTVSLDALVSSIRLYCLFSLGGFVWILFALLNNQRRMRGFSLFLLAFAVALSHQFFMYLLLYWPGLWLWETRSAGLGPLRIGPILLMCLTAAIVVAGGVQVFFTLASRWSSILREGMHRLDSLST